MTIEFSRPMSHLNFAYGKRCAGAGHWPEALAAFQQAVARNSAAGSNWFTSLAGAAEQVQDWATVASAYASAIKTAEQPKPGWFYKQGQAYQKLGHWPEALNKHITALATQGTAWTPQSLYLIGCAHEGAGQHVEAIKYYLSVFLAQPDFPRILSKIESLKDALDQSLLFSCADPATTLPHL